MPTAAQNHATGQPLLGAAALTIGFVALLLAFTEVEVDVALERAVGVERGPAAAAHLVALVRTLPQELNAWLVPACGERLAELPALDPRSWFSGVPQRGRQQRLEYSTRPWAGARRHSRLNPDSESTAAAP